jgi:hypothetical protein
MLQTQRRYDEPSVSQLALFLDNRVGKLREALRHLTAEDVLVHAISIVDSADHAIVRIVVDRAEVAYDTLREVGFPLVISDLLAVEVPNERHGLRMICRALLQGEMNINYAYPMLTRPRGFGVLLVHVENVRFAADVLQDSGFQLLDGSDLEGEGVSGV